MSFVVDVSIVKILFSFMKCPGHTNGWIVSAENKYRMQCFYWTESRHWHIAWYTTALRGIINLYGRHVYTVKKIIYPNQNIVPRGSHFTRNEQHFIAVRHKWHFLIVIRKLQINIAYDSLCIHVLIRLITCLKFFVHISPRIEVRIITWIAVSM